MRYTRYTSPTSTAEFTSLNIHRGSIREICTRLWDMRRPFMVRRWAAMEGMSWLRLSMRLPSAKLKQYM